MKRFGTSLRSLARIAAIVTLGGFLAPVCAPAQTGDPAHAVQRPGEGGPADTVRVSVALLDIAKIDDAEQMFFIDAYLVFEWTDPRLASKNNGSSPAELRRIPLDTIWTPGLLTVNARGLETRLPWVGTVDGSGNVTVRQRVSGSLAVDLDLRDFPFDTQTLTLDFVSYLHTPSELTFADDSRLLARPETFSAEGWSFEPAETRMSVYRLREAAPGAPRITFAITAKRTAAFYILTLAMPLTLVVLLSWVVHWVPPDLVSSRIGMASATVFSLIALSVTFRLTLPQIDYLTRADRFVLYSTILVAISLCVAVAAAHLIHRDRDVQAMRLTRATRILFPFAYLLAIGLAALG